MTDQIVIKLNKKKFQPLLDSLIKRGGNISSSYSEAVGKSLFFLYSYFNEKIPRLDNKTRHEYLLFKTDSSEEVTLLTFLKEYKRYISDS
jgi:hypothetical protein